MDGRERRRHAIKYLITSALYLLFAISSRFINSRAQQATTLANSIFKAENFNRTMNDTLEKAGWRW